jgi:hypothetical protein
VSGRFSYGAGRYVHADEADLLPAANSEAPRADRRWLTDQQWVHRQTADQGTVNAPHGLVDFLRGPYPH